jgi:hypothetical protein
MSKPLWILCFIFLHAKEKSFFRNIHIVTYVCRKKAKLKNMFALITHGGYSRGICLRRHRTTVNDRAYDLKGFCKFSVSYFNISMIKIYYVSCEYFSISMVHIFHYSSYTFLGMLAENFCAVLPHIFIRIIPIKIVCLHNRKE